ncbi:ubiquitin-domain-containing protein [Obba rivulosa]|uniref:Ubiquitin-domain-containing protein n=1 Tax=Obba rivulosa TaxID=1052685 RepID=A0A8E2ALB6_9APHY|nr:ubiquitin-domain-containing protein [Obba rivulosa]
MADQAELAFVKNFVNNISSQPVVYPNDFQQPPAASLKKVDVPPPPEPKAESSATLGSVNLVFKSLKPPKSYILSVQPTDTIADIKAQIAAQPGAPPVDVQRLLLKGKALADNKLLKEYNVNDGDTVNLMVKPGFNWDPTKATDVLSGPSASPSTGGASITLLPASEPKSRTGHTRIPSVVLSPSPSLSPAVNEKVVDIPLTLDTSSIPSPSTSGPSHTPYHATVSQPAFWERLYMFLSSELPNQSDAATAWEDFFCASKGALTASEIAKIRDHVGVIGMAGT